MSISFLVGYFIANQSFDAGSTMLVVLLLMATLVVVLVSKYSDKCYASGKLPKALFVAFLNFSWSILILNLALTMIKGTP